jgi:pimeloyl-ACP methyl ester carboxylesterase
MPIRETRLELAGYRTRALEVESAIGTESARAPVMLLHGWPDSADTWRRLLAAIAERGRSAIAFDMPGFGASAALDADQPILAQLDAFAATAIERESERAGGRHVILAGNSLGAAVAMRAAERPDLPLAGIVPIAPAGLSMARWFRIIEGERLLRLLLASPVPLPELVVRDAVGRVYRTVAFADGRVADAATVAAFTRHVRTRADVVRILGTGRRLLPELRDPFRLDRIRCPVLLVWGDSDRMVFPAGAERVLRAVAGSRIEVIEHCGHCPQIEATERLAELVENFAAGALAPAVRSR